VVDCSEAFRLTPQELIHEDRHECVHALWVPTRHTQIAYNEQITHYYTKHILITRYSAYNALLQDNNALYTSYVQIQVLLVTGVIYKACELTSSRA
jgi:hypothetical protein